MEQITIDKEDYDKLSARADETGLNEEVEFWLNEKGITLKEDDKFKVIEEMVRRIDNLIDNEIEEVVNDEIAR